MQAAWRDSGYESYYNLEGNWLGPQYTENPQNILFEGVITNVVRKQVIPSLGLSVCCGCKMSYAGCLLGCLMQLVFHSS